MLLEFSIGGEGAPGYEGVLAVATMSKERRAARNGAGNSVANAWGVGYAARIMSLTSIVARVAGAALRSVAVRVAAPWLMMELIKADRDNPSRLCGRSLGGR